MNLIKWTMNDEKLEALKTALRRSTPNVKSSHRCEAMGRALGYRTYAALLHSIKQAGVEFPGTFQMEPFIAYLDAHGFTGIDRAEVAKALKCREWFLVVT